MKFLPILWNQPATGMYKLLFWLGLSYLIYFQSTVNDLNVHKATKEEQVASETFITAK